MEILKKLFPLSFKFVKDVANLIVGILIYLFAGVVLNVIAFACGWIPVIGAIIVWVTGIIGSVLGLYCLAGIIIQLLVYFKVIKD